jgi:hypothetical protein
MQVNINPQSSVDSLIVFLVLEATDIQDHLAEMVHQVKNIHLKESTKVYLLKDRITRIKDLQDNHTHYGLSLNELRYNVQTLQTELTPVELTGVDPTDGYAWRDALRQICSIHKPGFSTLILWSHAAGIGIYKLQTKEFTIERNRFNLIRNYHLENQPLNIDKFNCLPVRETNNALIVHSFPDGTQCPELQKLFISEIANGLQGISNEPVFDIIVMANCYTQMADNCYNLSRIARYYLAPVTRIDVGGYDFPDFISTVNSSAYTRENCKGAARLLINGYIRKQPDLEKSTVIFFNDLKNIQAMKVLLNNMCVHIRQNASTIYPVIDTLLNTEAVTYLDNRYVDIVVLFDALKRELQSAEFEKVYNPLINFLLQGIVIDRHIGSDCQVADFNCFSLYLPRLAHHTITELFCCQYFYGFADSQFLDETLWDDLVVNFTRWRLK